MNCPTCQDEMRQVPAGVSKKTGKPYRAFWACDKQACKEAKAQNRTNTPSQPQNAPTAQFNPDYKALEEKVATLELAMANMRQWASVPLEKRLQGIETLLEGMQMNKAALPLHQSFAPRDIREPKVQEAADIVNSYKSDPLIPVVELDETGFPKV